MQCAIDIGERMAVFIGGGSDSSSTVIFKAAVLKACDEV